MDDKQTSRLGVALAASLGFHLFVLVVAEVTSSPASPKSIKVPPIEISRVVAEGSPLPKGEGDGSFNSRPSIASPGFGRKYDLDAGVPSNIPVPPKQPSVAVDSQPIQQPPANEQKAATESTGFPVYSGQQPSVPQPRSEPPRSQQPPIQAQASADSNTPPSKPSRANSAGNQGKERSRGPNRLAFPIFTVEPQVPTSLVTGGVSSSVDVSVEVAADGSHVERIVRSSGSSQVDDMVLAALKQWKWDPAAREGKEVASTQNFKFNFKPR
jgi:protein TonB